MKLKPKRTAHEVALGYSPEKREQRLAPDVLRAKLRLNADGVPAARALALTFRNLCVYYYRESSFTEPGAPDIGRMRNLIRRHGSSSVVMVFGVLEHWDEFVRACGMNVEERRVRPSIGFLLRYSDVAYDFTVTGSGERRKVSDAVKSMQEATERANRYLDSL